MDEVRVYVINGVEYRVVKKIPSSDFAASTEVVVSRERTFLLKIYSKKERESRFIDNISCYYYEIKKLNHPAIMRIYEIVDDEDCLIVLSECVFEMESLSVMVRKHTFQRNEIVDIGKQICDVLAYLHKLNPRHLFLEIVPSNIALTKDGRMRLFELNGLKVGDRFISEGIVGVDEYRAPEIYFGLNESADDRTEVYLIGAVLCFLMTRKSPREIAYKEIRWHRFKWANSDRLERIIYKCLEPNPAKRFQNSEAFYEALSDI